MYLAHILARASRIEDYVRDGHAAFIGDRGSCSGRQAEAAG